MSKILRLDSTQEGFNDKLDALLSREADTGADVQDLVAAILADVKQRGNAALCEYTERFDAPSANDLELKEKIEIEMGKKVS